ncbi:MAG: Uma2 family endonuclease [Gemmatimonadetes bacterium]|nr:Uma2 family endonuclease [Gemmatimonadota bacterium]
MAMPVLVPGVRPGEWTADLVRQLPEDGNRYEVIDGELLVSPSPRGRHQRSVFLLGRILEAFARDHRLGVVMLSPSDVEYSPRRMVQPDVYVVPREMGGKVAYDWDRVPQLMLVVEVLSPSTARYDRVTKRRMYLAQGVPQYWVVDPQARLIERWTPDCDRPAIHDASIDWHPASHAPTLTIDLPAYFDEVHEPFPEDSGW